MDHNRGYAAKRPQQQRQTTPRNHTQKRQTNVAAHLLTQGYNVSEAAIKIRFNDARYFSRQFKALFGYLPSKHLEKSKEG